MNNKSGSSITRDLTYLTIFSIVCQKEINAKEKYGNVIVVNFTTLSMSLLIVHEQIHISKVVYERRINNIVSVFFGIQKIL